MSPDEVSPTYRSEWEVAWGGAEAPDRGTGAHWFPVGCTADGRVMWRRPKGRTGKGALGRNNAGASASKGSGRSNLDPAGDDVP